MFRNLSSIGLSQLSNLSAGRYAPLWVPVATQLVYRWARYNVYRNFSTVDDFNRKLVQQRKDQHRLFIVFEGAQVITFLALSTLNRSYLIPACYTLLHLAWTHYSKTQEKLIPETPSAPAYWDSMDGMKPFKVVR
ncbi:MAG TPA: hypothetical protein VIJ14_04650 [Rhabdochlamydiaceae bacterium]